MNSSIESIHCQHVVVLPPVEYKKVPRETLPDAVGKIFRASGHLLIIKETYKCTPKQFIGSVRSIITGFSPSAGTRMRRYLRECISDYGEMVTLTYPGFYESNGKAVKEHLRRFLQEIRRQYIREKGDDGKHSSFWFLEFQARGAPHFHIFTTWAPNKEWVAKTWYRIVNSEDERHLHAGTRVEFLRHGRAATISYASKYAVKLEQKAVPENYENVGRFWGVHGRRSVVSADTFVQANEEDAPNIKSAVDSIYNLLKNAIHEGQAEIIVREQGVLVAVINDKVLQRKFRVKILHLSLKVQRWSSFFLDAEVDVGEGRQL